MKPTSFIPLRTWPRSLAGAIFVRLMIVDASLLALATLLRLAPGACLVAEFSKLARALQKAPFALLPLLLGGRWINKFIESLAGQIGSLRSALGAPRA